MSKKLCWYHLPFLRYRWTNTHTHARTHARKVLKYYIYIYISVKIVFIWECFYRCRSVYKSATHLMRWHCVGGNLPLITPSSYWSCRLTVTLFWFAGCHAPISPRFPLSGQLFYSLLGGTSRNLARCLQRSASSDLLLRYEGLPKVFEMCSFSVRQRSHWRFPFE